MRQNWEDEGKDTHQEEQPSNTATNQKTQPSKATEPKFTFGSATANTAKWKFNDSQLSAVCELNKLICKQLNDLHDARSNYSLYGTVHKPDPFAEPVQEFFLERQMKNLTSGIFCTGENAESKDVVQEIYQDIQSINSISVADSTSWRFGALSVGSMNNFSFILILILTLFNSVLVIHQKVSCIILVNSFLVNK